MWMGDTRLPRQVYTTLNPSHASSTPTRVGPSIVRSFTVTMRTTQIKATAAAVRRLIWQVDPNLPLDSPTILDDQWDNVFGRQRFTLQLMAAFALVALLLAAAGIFAVCRSSSVSGHGRSAFVWRSAPRPATSFS
jgi:hypothetical protein